MNLQYAFFAKHAELLKDDTVGALGACFDGIKVPTVPFFMTSMCIVVHLKCTPAECGIVHRLGLRILLPDGTPFEHGAPGTATFTPTLDRDAPTAEPSATTIIALYGMPLMQEGRFEFEFSVDDVRIGSVSLRVIRFSPVAGAQEIAGAQEVTR